MSDYTKDIEQDELILAAIIAGGMASGRKVAPERCDPSRGQLGHGNCWGVGPATDPAGPCCAVGAGVLFSGLQGNPPEAFSIAFDVDMDYVWGVSGAFEGYDGPDSDPRGVAVGAAAYDFFHGDD